MVNSFIETHVATVIRTVIIGMSSILIPYFTYKFYTLRTHFICKGRYPIITIIASNSMLMVGIMFLILSYLEYIGYINDNDYIKSDKFWLNIVLSISNTSSFNFCALILYRTWLVHKKWNQSKRLKKNKNRPTLNSIPHFGIPSVSVDIESDSIPKNNDIINMNVRYKDISMFIIIVGCGLTAVCYYFRNNIMYIIAQTLWVFVVIYAIIIVIKTLKTKEALNCIRECYIVIFIIIAILVSSFTIDSREWRFCVATIVALLGCYTLLCLPIILIYNIEGTISPQNIFSDNIIGSNEKSTDIKFTEYINKSEKNYHKFKSYLVDCVAVESLLFYTDTIIFREVLIELLSKNYPITSAGTDLPNSPIKFDYLKDIKQAYNIKINSKIIDDNVIENIKQIGNDLKRKYIDGCADCQINISYHCRQKLLQFYDEINNINNINNDHSIFIVKYICAFGPSLRETLRLLNSVYNFNFKK